MIDESLLSTKYIEPLVWILMVWLLNEVWSSHKKLLSKLTSETERNTVAIMGLDNTMAHLQEKIESLSDKILTPHSGNDEPTNFRKIHKRAVE